jgi:hypothetical protein
MNTWNQLQAILDAIFAHGSKATSTVKKVQQGFDNKTNEHVAVIEYRVRMTGESVKNRGFPLLAELDDQAARRI